MKILVTQVLKNYEGKPIFEQRAKRDQKGKTVRDDEDNPITEDVELTLRSVITGSLLGEDPNPKKPRTAEDKNKAHQINTKIWQSKATNLTVQERSYIIERVGIFYNPLILGRVEEIFEDGKEDEEVKEPDKVSK